MDSEVCDHKDDWGSTFFGGLCLLCNVPDPRPQRMYDALQRLSTGKFDDLDGKHWSEVAREALGA